MIIGSVIILYSCSLFELDNYSAPDSTLQGVVTDMDGNPLLVESGNGIRIKLMDYGWHDDPLPIFIWQNGRYLYKYKSFFKYL